MTNLLKNKYVKYYYDKFSLWTQLYGVIGIFGSFIVALLEIPAYVGLPIISIFMFVSGAFFCTVNMLIDKADFNEMYEAEYSSIKDKIDRGELPKERLDMFRRMFK